jgi:ATP-dependent Clp protease ATP-binding subunit ClpA
LRDFEQHIKDKLERILNGWREQRDEREVIVTGDDIMHIVSKWTGVPLNRMEQKEAQKLLNMEEELKQQVIGQDGGGDRHQQGVKTLPSRSERSTSPNRVIHIYGSNRRRKNVSGTFLGAVHVW